MVMGLKILVEAGLSPEDPMDILYWPRDHDWDQGIDDMTYFNWNGLARMRGADDCLSLFTAAEKSTK